LAGFDPAQRNEMIRRILCADCGKPKPSDPEDFALGWRSRRLRLTANASRSLLCDNCGEAIQDGKPMIAQTFWNQNNEGEPPAWEQLYGIDEQPN